MIKRLCLLTAIVLLSGAAVSAQNLVVDGDFETPTIDRPYLAFGDGATIGGWTVEYHSVDIIGSYWQAARGSQSLELSGDQPGGINQHLSTELGKFYTLRFAMAANPEYTGPKVMEVWWGGSKLDTLRADPTGHSFTNMGWTYHSYTVSGNGGDLLRFASLGWPECYGPVIDDVSVSAVPEPSSLVALVCGGVGSVARLLRALVTSLVRAWHPGWLVDYLSIPKEPLPVENPGHHHRQAR